MGGKSMELTLVKNGHVFEVKVPGEVLFTGHDEAEARRVFNKQKNEARSDANHGYTEIWCDGSLDQEVVHQGNYKAIIAREKKDLEKMGCTVKLKHFNGDGSKMARLDSVDEPTTLDSLLSEADGLYHRSDALANGKRADADDPEARLSRHMVNVAHEEANRRGKTHYVNYYKNDKPGFRQKVSEYKVSSGSGHQLYEAKPNMKKKYGANGKRADAVHYFKFVAYKGTKRIAGGEVSAASKSEALEKLKARKEAMLKGCEFSIMSSTERADAVKTPAELLPNVPASVRPAYLTREERSELEKSRKGHSRDDAELRTFRLTVEKPGNPVVKEVEAETPSEAKQKAGIWSMFNPQKVRESSSRVARGGKVIKSYIWKVSGIPVGRPEVMTVKARDKSAAIKIATDKGYHVMLAAAADSAEPPTLDSVLSLADELYAKADAVTRSDASSPQPGDQVTIKKEVFERMRAGGYNGPRVVRVKEYRGGDVVFTNGGRAKAAEVDSAARGDAEYSTTKYEFSHGKKPKGSGSWAFLVDGETVFVPGQKSLTDARAWVKQQHPDARKIEVAP
jgi:hypothetical protein